jgi:genome maintenance exonuclease 1
MAHDYVYKSNIKQGVIMICTPDLYYQEFKIQDADLKEYKHKFLKRLDMYHELQFDEKERVDFDVQTFKEQFEKRLK